jgi:hypothetical protein
MKEISEFMVFYRDYLHDVSISSANPEPLAGDRLIHLAEHLLSDPDNFLGVEDQKHTVLQMYANEDGSIILELLYPESDGCLQLKRTRQQAMEILAGLPAVFEDGLLPGANYIG